MDKNDCRSCGGTGEYEVEGSDFPCQMCGYTWQEVQQLVKALERIRDMADGGDIRTQDDVAAVGLIAARALGH